MPWCLPDAGISVIDKETAVKNMKILVVGGGGREHAIVWKLAQSRHKPELFCAPGNGGIAKIAKCIPIKATDIGAMVDFAVKNDIDLTVVAPDDPLAMGMVDALQAAGKRAFGPTAAAALIEASKGFSKQLMKKYGIPTADYRIFDNYAAADEYLKSAPMPIVIKADGLALGKGVIIAENYSQASAAAKDMLEGGAFGGAGSTIVIEEYMTGPEMSMLCFTDGFRMLAEEEIDSSILAAIGRAVAWIFAPLGWGNWQAAVASITGLVAKENIVGTMGILYGGGGANVYAALAQAFTPIAGYSFLVFNLLCAPCFAAMGAIKREMNSAKWTWFAIGYQCLFAYAIALMVYQFGGMFTGNINVIGLIFAFAILAFMIYMLVRPYKEATKLETKVKANK